MDDTTESIVAALKARLAPEDRPHVMLKIGPVNNGARLVEIGRAGWWQAMIVPTDAGAIEIAQTATLLVRALAARPVPLAEVA